MSSHHVVREAQEPALFILETRELSTEALGPLLEWSPTLVVHASALEAVMAMGIKADVLVAGVAEQEQLSHSIELQSPIEIITLAPEEEPLLPALRYLAKKEHRAVNVFAAGEEVPWLLKLLSTQQLIENIVNISGGKRYCLCRSGLFTKWYPAKEEISLHPVIPCRVSTQGMEPEFRQKQLNGTETFRTNAAARIQVEADGPFWLIENMES